MSLWYLINIKSESWGLTILDLDSIFSYKIKASKVSEIIWTSRIALYYTTTLPHVTTSFFMWWEKPQRQIYLFTKPLFLTWNSGTRFSQREKLQLTRCIIYHSAYNNLLLWSLNTLQICYSGYNNSFTSCEGFMSFPTLVSPF